MASKEFKNEIVFTLNELQNTNGPNQLVRCDNTGKIDISNIPGGVGGIASVNGQIGDVILDTDDIFEGVNKLFLSPTEKTQNDDNNIEITNAINDIENNNGNNQLVRTNVSGLLPSTLYNNAYLSLNSYHAYEYSLQNTTSGTWTTLSTGFTINTPVGYGGFSSGKYSCHVSGWYAVYFNGVFNTNSVGYMQAKIRHIVFPSQTEVIDMAGPNLITNTKKAVGDVQYVQTFSVVYLTGLDNWTGSGPRPVWSGLDVQMFQNRGTTLTAGGQLKVARIA